jgi:hypothetical protein
VVQVTEAVRQARDRRDFQQQLRQGREFTGGMLILLNIWREIGKQTVRNSYAKGGNLQAVR